MIFEDRTALGSNPMTHSLRKTFSSSAPEFAPAVGSLRALAPWRFAFPTTRPIYTTKTDSTHSFSPNEPAPQQQAAPSYLSHHSPVRTSQSQVPFTANLER